MTRWGLLIARRRPFLSILTTLCAVLPILCAGTLWVIDSHTIPTEDQTRRSSMGSAPAVAKIDGANSVDAADRTESALRAAGAEPVRQTTILQLPLTVHGVTRAVNGRSRDWTGDFKGVLTLVAGHLPLRTDEVVVSSGLAATVPMGSKVSIGPDRYTVVGVGTEPLLAGDAESVFLPHVLPSHIRELPSSVYFFTLHSPRALTADLQDELSLVLTMSDTVESRASVGAQHPILLGGTVLGSVALLLLSVRLVTVRVTLKTARAMRDVGATNGEIARAESVATVAPALLGLAVGWLVVGVEWLVVPNAIAAAHQIQRPFPAFPWLGMLALTLGFLIPAAAPTWWQPLPSETGRTQRRWDWPHRPQSTVRLGLRIMSVQRHRSLRLSALAFTLCALAAVFSGVTATADQAEAALARQDGLRPGAVLLSIDDPHMAEPARAAVEKVLGQRLYPVLEAQHQGEPVLVNGASPDAECGVLSLIATRDEWKALTGKSMSDDGFQALQRGEVISLSDKCVGPVHFSAPEGQLIGDSARVFAVSTDDQTASRFASVMGVNAARDRGILGKKTTLVGSSVRPIEPARQEEARRALESLGISAENLRFGENLSVARPLIATFVLIEVSVLLAILCVISSVAIAWDERRTHSLLHQLGMSRISRASLQGILSAIPLAMGCVAGYTTGIALGYLVIPALIDVPTTVNMDMLVPLWVFAALPAVAWWSTPRLE